MKHPFDYSCCDGADNNRPSPCIIERSIHANGDQTAEQDKSLNRNRRPDSEFDELPAFSMFFNGQLRPHTAHQSTANFKIPGFEFIPSGLQAILRVSGTSYITMVGLRARYNERGDFLITTMPATSEDAATTPGTTLSFPHFVDGAGYVTQFILMGSSERTTSGSMRSFSKTGQPLDLNLK